jgi:hypothetical protein
MSKSLEEAIKSAAKKIGDSLIGANQDLARYLESPFLPIFQRSKLLEQIRENQRMIERLLLVKVEKI